MEFIDYFILFQPGQLLQTQVQDRLCLGLCQTVTLVGQPETRRQVLGARGIRAGAREHRLDRARLPGPLDELLLRLGRARRRLDQRNHLVDIGERDREAFEQVRALAGLAQIEQGAPGHHLAPVAQEVLQQLLEIQRPRLAVDQRDDIDAEYVLQLRLLVQVVQDHLGNLAAAQFDDHAHTVLVGLVAQFADAFELLVLHQLGDLFQQPSLVDLVGQLADHDPLPTVFHLFDAGAGADIDLAATGAVGLAHAMDTVDDRRGREVRRGHDVHQLVDADARRIDHTDAGVDDLRQIVWRDIGGHAHRDPGGAVDQQVRYLGRQYLRFMLRFVVVRDEIDRLLVDVGEQLMRNLRHAHLGVTHGRRRIAVDRPEVALPVDQHVAQ